MPRAVEVTCRLQYKSTPLLFVAIDVAVARPWAYARAAHFRIASCTSSNASNAIVVRSATFVWRQIDALFMSEGDIADHRAPLGGYCCNDRWNGSHNG